ncbi:DUF1217 domain-containing protein [Paracoccus ravus]|uniref:DUF1217 domain-containing protein n=1 Tax=Paracoccus ravus TaxID=2447760 RepID=UPI00106EF8AF|nr:DUF1217 domain-containing protein [Paracoccus ravus]
MISTAGMSPLMALSLIQRERAVFEDSVRSDAVAKREIAAFRDRIGTIDSVDALIKDHEVFSFVMKSFGMENQIYAKAMVRKILTSDPEDEKSLVKRLTNADYEDLNAAMGFATDGTANAENFTDPTWIEDMVQRYVGQSLVDQQSDVNASTGIGLDFLQNASDLTGWYKVLADKNATTVLRIALGLPESVLSGDIDAQKKMFEKKMDIADLQDPEKVQQLLRRYAAIQGANEASQAPVSILTLFSSATSSGTWAPITLDVTSISSFKGYR